MISNSVPTHLCAAAAVVTRNRERVLARYDVGLMASSRAFSCASRLLMWQGENSDFAPDPA